MDNLAEATKNLLTAAAGCSKAIRARSGRLLTADAEVYWKTLKGSEEAPTIGRQRLYNFLREKDLLAVDIAGSLLFDYLDRDDDDVITFAEFSAGFGLRKPADSPVAHQPLENSFGALLASSTVEYPAASNHSSSQAKLAGFELELIYAVRDMIEDLVTFEKKRVAVYNSVGFNLDKIFSQLAAGDKKISRESIRSCWPELGSEQIFEVFAWLTRDSTPESCSLKELRRALTPIAISFDELIVQSAELFDLSLMKYSSPNRYDSTKKESLGGFGFSFQEEFELREVAVASPSNNPRPEPRPGPQPPPIALNLNYNFDSMSDQPDMLPTERKSPSKFIASIRIDDAKPTQRSDVSESPNSKVSTQRAHGRHPPSKPRLERETESHFYRVSRSPTPPSRPLTDPDAEVATATFEQRLKAIGPIDEEKLRSACKRYQPADPKLLSSMSNRYQTRLLGDNKASSGRIAVERPARPVLLRETSDCRPLQLRTDSAARLESLRRNYSTYREDRFFEACSSVLRERNNNLTEHSHAAQLDTSRKPLFTQHSAASLHRVSASSPLQTGRGNRSSEVWHSIERTLPSTSRKLSSGKYHNSSSTYSSSAQHAPQTQATVQIIRQTEVVRYASHRYARYH